MYRWLRIRLLLCVVSFSGICLFGAEPKRAADVPFVPFHYLQADDFWRLNLPGGAQFDASGLLLRSNEVLTINDRGATVYRVQFSGKTNEANLLAITNWFTTTQLSKFAAEKRDRYDAEGLAQDSEGRIYICDEANRWILRFDPKRLAVEKLPIDWKPAQRWFHSNDFNASFEGVAVGGGRLYVANERQSGRVFVVDLKTMEIIDDFAPRPASSEAGEIHYSDLCWFDGALFVLLREHRMILEVDPKTKKVVAQYGHAKFERAREHVYDAPFIFGSMEGLAVDKEFFWLVTDNNGRPRKADKTDTRPTLFRCRRPAR